MNLLATKSLLQKASVSISAKSFLILALNAFMGGCGDDSSSPAPKTPFVEVVPKGTPAAYHLADPTCQEQTAPVQLTSTTLPSWSGLNIVSEAVALHEISSSSSLTSPAALETVYGRVYERQCSWDQDHPGACPDLRNGHGTEEKGWELTDKGKPLRLCAPGHTYPRDSYEGVALTSMYFLERAHARFTSETAGNFAVPKVSLQILPNFISYFDGYQENGQTKRLAQYLTRNLAYFPVQTGLTTPMLVVWPEPQSKTDEWVGGLWESGFVLAHEFGHHLELGVLNAGASRTSGFDTLRWNPVLHTYEDISPDGAAAGGNSSASQARKSISEAFADLVGFYTEDNSALGISGMPCFGHNRDVENGNFQDDSPKVLTTEVVQEVSKGPARSGCDGGKPNFGDAHLVGAVIAYGTNRILSQVIELSGGEKSHQYRMAIDWIRALREEQNKGTPASKTDGLFPLRAGIESAVNSYLSRRKDAQADFIPPAQLRRDVCMEFSALFPALSKPAFALENGTCPPVSP